MGVESTASSSAQVSASTEDLARNATEAAHAITVLRTRLHSMTDAVQSGAGRAGDAVQVAESVARSATEGGEMVRSTVDWMKDIAVRITVIEDVAQQTNPLALDAAIEAATTGEELTAMAEALASRASSLNEAVAVFRV